MKTRQCIYCKGVCCKNGHGRNGEQRYKCIEKKCGRSFTQNTENELKSNNQKRVVLHLVLAGCKVSDVSTQLNIKRTIIKKWIHFHLKDAKNIKRRG